MIRLSLLETEGCDAISLSGSDAISLSGKENLIQKILELPRETSGILISIDWNAIRATNSSIPHARRGLVLSTRGELMRTSCRSGADSIEYTSGSDALVFFGFRWDLLQLYL